ncbi:CBS domain-containing protein [Candidatus Micrarchaeota archaeon]|nr:CBS domain-containing protein [Candidatus Micrarchaeota archaeon]
MLEIEKIGKLRRQLGLTQKELATLSGVSQSLIAKIESGRIDPAYSKVTQILAALEGYTRKDKKRAEQIMSSPVIWVSPKDSLDKSIELMQKNELSQIPVFENEKCVGSIMDSLIVSLLTDSKNRNIHALSVSQVMAPSFPQVPFDSSTDALADLLKHYRAILIEKNGKIIGIVTKADLFKAI